MEDLRWDTRVVHAGDAEAALQFATSGGRPTATPIILASAAEYASTAELDAAFDRHDAFVYARHGSPTVSVAAAAVAELEGTEGAVVTASGMAALHLALVAAGAGPGPGRGVLASTDLYGATGALLSDMAAQGIPVDRLCMAETDAARAAIARVRPRVVLAETVANPLLRVADVPALAEAAHAVGAVVVVDNTFATPHLFRPAEHGADAVVESATKYLSGHGDVLAGTLAAGGELLERARMAMRRMGATVGAVEAYLLLRGMRTLALRLERQVATARAVAQATAAHPAVARVFYPERADHPDHATARRLFADRGAGGVVALEVRGGRAAALGTLDRLRLFGRAPTLGDIRAQALHPASTSHRGLTEAERARAGIGDGLIRLAVGIGDTRDLVEDVLRALPGS